MIDIGIPPTSIYCLNNNIAFYVEILLVVFFHENTFNIFNYYFFVKCITKFFKI